MLDLNLLKEKLLFDKVSNVLVLNEPEGTYFVNEMSDEDMGAAMLYFCYKKTDIDEFVEKVGGALQKGLVLWMAYPKKSGALKADINRDQGWEGFINLGYKPVTQISLNADWSALRFRPADEVKHKKVVSQYIDKNLKTVQLPPDMASALEETAISFFNTLSYSSKKEFVEWVEDAKKETTRQNRIEKSNAMLLSKKKVPY